ncbi:hypothetical protein SESBI_01648 [Sesbania bispinosa]|nr:hypothetical protein SESBI_01648 [Sesbania bispinosa]
MGDVVEPIRVLGARKERRHGEDIIQWKGKSVDDKTDFEGGGRDRAHEQRGQQGDQLLGQHSRGPRI